MPISGYHSVCLPVAAYVRDNRARSTVSLTHGNGRPAPELQIFSSSVYAREDAEDLLLTHHNIGQHS